MQQVIFEVIFPFLISLLMLGASFLVGNFVFEKLKINPRFGNLFNFAISAILGFGLIANFSLVLSLLNILNAIVVWLVVAVILFVGRKKLINFLSQFLFSLKNFKINNFLEGLLMFLIAAGFLFYFISTFSPPYKNDSIAYHLPNTIEVANGHLISMGGYGKWSENMPILMETLYAWLYRMGGFNLINLCHYQITLLVFLLIYCLIKKEFSRLAGLVAVVLLLGFHPVLTHATDAHVYGNLLAFELSAVLLFFIWAKYQEKGWLVLSGAMFGLALATKYTPLYSFLAITLFFLFFSLKNRVGKKDFIYNCFYFFAPVIIIASFWYLKNFILLENPFYPFIFNHKGQDEKMFATFLFDSHYGLGLPFVKDTLSNFLLLPLKLFWSPYYVTLLASFLFFPLGLVISENKSLLRWMMFFAAAYMALWFFVISHVILYGLLAPSMFMIVAGITIAWLIQNKFQRVFEHRIFKVLVVVFLCFAVFTLAFYKNSRVASQKITEVKYMLGIIDKGEFYHANQLGELFEISNYINKNFSNTKIINSWDNFNLFLQNGNKYVSLSDYMVSSPTSTATLCEYLTGNNITLVYINYDYKSRVVGEKWNQEFHPENTIWKNLDDLEKNIIVPNSQIIFEKFSGKLFKINSCKN